MEKNTFILFTPPSWLAPIKKIIMIINFTTLLMIITLLQVSADGFGQITLNEKKASLEKVFKNIESQSDYVFFLRDNNLKSQSVDVQVSNVSIEAALNACFKDVAVNYRIIDKTVVINRASRNEAKRDIIIDHVNATDIRGKVTDKDGLSLSGVSIRLKGTSIGAVTDTNGQYMISVPATDGILVFSYIGFGSQEISINGLSSINVILIEDHQTINEVVVVGYGTQRKANLTGAVATIDMEKVVGTRPIADLGRALQGATPGLTITSASGNPGLNPKIRLRGLSGSLNGGGAQPLILLDNVEIQDLQLVNPDDVESISVLKDAASASIYGSRAAWGVILIASKSGKKGAPNKISYTNNLSWATPTRTPEIAPAAEGAEMALAAARRRTPGLQSYSVIGMSFDDIGVQKMREWEDKYGGQNLGSEMVLGRDFEIRGGQTFYYRPWNPIELYAKDWAPQQKHDVNISGGSEKTAYHLGLGYLGQSGILKVNPDKFDRYNLSLGVNSSIRDWLDVRGKVMVFNTTTTQPYIWNADASSDGWYYLSRWQKTYPYGTYNGYRFRSSISEAEQSNLDETKTNLSRIQLGSTFKIVSGLTLEADYTYSATNSHFHSVGGGTSGINFWVYSLDNSPNFQSASHNRVRYESDWNEINTGKLFATYLKAIKGHNFKLITGGDIEFFQNTGQTSQRLGLLDFSKGEISLAIGDQNVAGYRNQFSTLGYFGRINYSYKNKYLLELNGRFDGSSRFPVNEQWGFFPSMSVGYVVTEEPFMEFATPVFSFLKFRGSYGSVGNQDVGNSRFLSIVASTNSNWWVNGKNMVTVSTPGALSPSLTWETVSTLDFGLDATLFKDQFGVTFDWYKRTTSDMITSGVTLPTTFGTEAPVRNYGELRTKGWEFSLNWNKRLNNGLNFNVMGVLSDFKEEITKFANTTLGINSNREGRVLGEIWGYETDRLFTQDDFTGQDAQGNWIPKSGIPDQTLLKGNAAWFSYGPGDVKYKDLNGDGKVTYGSNTVDDPGDMKVIGNSTPRYQYGLRLGFDFKGFDFSAFVQGVGKRELWPSGPQFIPGFRYEEGWHANQIDYWTPENPDAFFPRPTQMDQSNNNLNFRIQTRYLLDMSYLRMKNIGFGYALPERLTDRVKMDRVRIYFSGENLFEFDKLNLAIDPETDYTDVQNARSFGSIYPHRRTFSFGIQVTL